MSAQIIPFPCRARAAAPPPRTFAGPLVQVLPGAAAYPEELARLMWSAENLAWLSIIRRPVPGPRPA